MIASTNPASRLTSGSRPRRAIAALMGGVVLSFGLISVGVDPVNAAEPAKAPPKLAANADGSPTTAAAAAYAWLLFTDAVTPTTGQAGPLTFENWTEQCAFNVGCPPSTQTASTVGASKGSKPARKARGSGLRGKLTQALNKSVMISRGDSGVSCATLGSAALPTPSPQKGVIPPKVVGQLFCEEIFVNPAETAFINTNGLATLTGQAAYSIKNGNQISLPWSAIEIKVDWVSQNSATCTSPTLYMEMIEFEGQAAQCFAMAGMHISSKVLPNWLWATFEPANSPANPNRCNPSLYGMCFDPWGTTSSVPYGMDKPAKQSPALAAMMKSKNLPAAFNNYFLTGVQTQFVDSKGVATQLGNSFVEYWAGVKPGQASCITCHSYAILQTNPPTEIGKGFPTEAQIGPGATVSSGQVQQDFSWMLGFAPATAPPPPAPKKK